jgi:hypothetical protein
MSSVVISGDTSGTVSVTVPAVAGTNTVTIPAGTGTIAVQGVSTNIVSGTAVASTSGTSIDFTGIPSWAKRITVMFNGISTNGTVGVFIVQIGSGSVTATGYATQSSNGTTFSGLTTTGFNLATQGGSAAYTLSGVLTLNLIGSNTWVGSSVASYTSTNAVSWVGSGNSPALGGALDRVRFTTFAGTDSFDAGTINILYE